MTRAVRSAEGGGAGTSLFAGARLGGPGCLSGISVGGGIKVRNSAEAWLVEAERTLNAMAKRSAQASLPPGDWKFLIWKLPGTEGF
ncbi:uncharacterized protein BJ212DRAFT_1320299 [Suillus subaureus]|uniref:Uncharacterized protein n=1 Tax=Suillus subaureus TaxID=48587 RepID=A0A9P7EK82_9AGAM|nr:uncharacterized protein BJ212DRAFT_1320299 [Suillus subaureus]KAG1824452.1 hypothetical protein BJ212DRAFT_1320299 [Suillus subaureus]